jgi:hypothetical protein
VKKLKAISPLAVKSRNFPTEDIFSNFSIIGNDYLMLAYAPQCGF